MCGVRETRTNLKFCGNKGIELKPVPFVFALMLPSEMVIAGTSFPALIGEASHCYLIGGASLESNL